ncbi:MAG: TIGR01777 family oxidoreductase [Gammaproteobacteria bacterium]|nr:TIGR01777 family oxidoreductase [Gammaproteobacteria bacterium]
MIPLEVWLVVSLQVVLGFADVAVHHELIARLPWRSGAAPELRLHGARNLVYAVIFLALAWILPLGWTALILAGLLLAEATITFIDWIVEDSSRPLPASERALHGLLAINFGVLLALLAPIVWQWLREPASVEFVVRGVWSWLATAAGAGLLGMAVRDFAASRRVDRFRTRPLPLDLPDRQRWLVTGGTGFVGRRLTEALAGDGHEVTVLTRDTQRARNLSAPFRVVTSLDQIDSSEHIDIVVHLAGEPVAGGPWTPARRERIERSRPEMAKRLIELIRRLKTKPEVLIGASAVGWYGDCGEAVLNEGANYQDCFAHRSCKAAEAAAAEAERLGVRVVMLRIGLVLGREDGLLAKLLTPFDLGLGARLGSGRQWMSWIERDDLVRLIAFASTHEALRGPVNAVAPHAVANRVFTKALARALRRPAWFVLPRVLLVGALGDMARELMLASQRAVPAKALDNGFEFRFPEIDAALARALS